MTRAPAELETEALARVARECPPAHARMHAALGTRSVELALGADIVHVTLDAAALAVPVVHVRASINTLCAVLIGELDVLEAVLSRRLDITGSPDDLAAAGDAMTWFLQGAVRCLSIKPLADELFALRTGEA
ncbi:MAG: hypothetical protein ABI867_06070 [Kofleriaceae bacterium]